MIFSEASLSCKFLGFFLKIPGDPPPFSFLPNEIAANSPWETFSPKLSQRKRGTRTFPRSRDVVYLKKDAIEGTDPQEFEYTLGPRAREEMDFMDCLKRACAVLGEGERPEAYIQQFRQAEQQIKDREEQLLASQELLPVSQGTIQLSTG